MSKIFHAVSIPSISTFCLNSTVGTVIRQNVLSRQGTIGGVPLRKVLLKISEIGQENTSVRASLFHKFAGLRLATLSKK